MKYQATILDLDGTLLDDMCQISSNNIDSIKLALAKGHKITLASGRPHNLMLSYAHQLGITAPIICCNGAYQYDPIKKVVTHGVSIDEGNRTQLIQHLCSKGFDFTLYGENGIFTTKESDHFLGLKKESDRLIASGEMGIFSSVSELIIRTGALYKVLVHNKDKTELCALRDELSVNYQADLSTPNKLDITAKGVNKGFATLNWLNQFGLTPEQTIAFGDGDNDIALFQVVGEPVAMANASPALRRIANLIVTDNNGCGIGQYLRLIVREGRNTSQHSLSY